MIRFLRGEIDGYCEFELTGTDAAKIMLVLGLDLVPANRDAGMILTLIPKDLTGDSCIWEPQGDPSREAYIDQTNQLELQGFLSSSSEANAG